MIESTVEQESLINEIVNSIPVNIKVNVFKKKQGCTVRFQNGYSASIIRGGYGSSSAPYELAVMHNEQLDYSTPITNDVIGYLTVPAIVELLCKINDLQIKE